MKFPLLRLPFRFSRLLPLGLLALTRLATPAALAASDAAKDTPVELPVYNVVDSRALPPPEEWLYARIPGFEVLSNAPKKATQRLVDDFQRFHLALDLVWPGVQRPSAVPTSLIICGRGQQYRKFLPAEQKNDQTSVSLTLREKEISSIVIDFETKVLNLETEEGNAAAAATAAAVTDDTVSVGGGNPGFRVDTYKQLYRQYIRFIVTGVEPRGPAWFEEGLAQLLMGIEITDTTIILGKLEDPNEISAEQGALNDAGVSGTAAVEDRDFAASLAKRRLLTMAEVFAVERDSPQTKGILGGTWAKQCYAFVHWALYGDEGKHQKAFITFLRRLDREPNTDALFKECFKQSYKDMAFTLRAYIEMTNHKIAGVQANKGEKLPKPTPVELRDATEPEVGRIKGDALRLAGNLPEARLAMTTPYHRGERDPQLLAAIGLLEHASGDDVKARKALEAAVVGNKATRPRAYLELARLRFAEAAAKPAEPPDRFSGQQTAAVLTPLFTARTQPPPLPEVYELIAEAWSRSVITPGKDHLVVLDEGLRLFPKDAALIYTTATQKIRAGLLPEALQTIEFGLRTNPSDDQKQKLEKLKASLPAPKN